MGVARLGMQILGFGVVGSDHVLGDVDANALAGIQANGLDLVSITALVAGRLIGERRTLESMPVPQA